MERKAEGREGREGCPQLGSLDPPVEAKPLHHPPSPSAHSYFIHKRQCSHLKSNCTRLYGNFFGQSIAYLTYFSFSRESISLCTCSYLRSPTHIVAAHCVDYFVRGNAVTNCNIAITRRDIDRYDKCDSNVTFPCRLASRRTEKYLRSTTLLPIPLTPISRASCTHDRGLITTRWQYSMNSSW